MQRRIDAELLRNILSLYTDVDKGEEKITPKEPQPRSLTSSIFGAVKSAGSRVISYINVDIGPELKTITDEVEKRIVEGNSPDDWVNLIIYLGNEAAHAERLHRSQWFYDKTKQSRCCDILLFLRNELLMELTEKNDDYKAALDKKIQTLKKEYTGADGKVTEGMANTRGLYVDTLRQEYKQKRRDLAHLTYDLVETVNIFKAREECGLDYLQTVAEKNIQLMKEFKRTTTIPKELLHKELPYAYQNYRSPDATLYGAKIMYDDRYKHLVGLDWEHFKERHGNYKTTDPIFTTNAKIYNKIDPSVLLDHYKGKQKDAADEEAVVLIKRKETSDKPKLKASDHSSNKKPAQGKKAALPARKQVESGSDEDELSSASEASVDSRPAARKRA